MTYTCNHILFSCYSRTFDSTVLFSILVVIIENKIEYRLIIIRNMYFLYAIRYKQGVWINLLRTREHFLNNSIIWIHGIVRRVENIFYFFLFVQIRFLMKWEEENRGKGEIKKRKKEKEKGGYPLHKLYLTAPAGARLFAHAFTCILYALLYKTQRTLVSNVRFIRQDKGVHVTRHSWFYYICNVWNNLIHLTFYFKY